MNSSNWVKFLKENVTPKDLEDETVYALIHYFKDLGLLVLDDSGDLKWQEQLDGLEFEDQKKLIRNGILKAAQMKSGFAVSFFIGFETIKLPELESLIETEKIKTGNVNNSKPEHSSDLSNLQIVKKVGRQLRPFLEAENAIVNRLLGKYTDKADARVLFQYMFGKMNSKAQPRKWEQLSRKRHR